MKRRLFNITSALSLLLCLATIAAGVRSYWVYEGWRLTPRPALPLPEDDNRSWQTIRWIGSSRGWLQVLEKDIPERKGVFSKISYLPGYERGVPTTSFLRSSPTEGIKGERYWAFPGFSFGNCPKQPLPGSPGGVVAGTRSLCIAWWLLALPSSILPAFWTWRQHLRLRSENRARHHLCFCCGYDLRASQDRCPECGSPIPTPNTEKQM